MNVNKIMLNTFFIQCTGQRQLLQLYNSSVKRYLSKCKFFNLSQHLLKNSVPNICIQYKQIHKSNIFKQKLRVETENNHAYTIMQALSPYKHTLSMTQQLDNVIEREEFDKVLDKHWRSESATNIVNAFKHLCHYANIHNIPLSDSCFDNLVDGLMDKCQDLSDRELSEILLCINHYPAPDSMTSHNFHDIWSALDDMCCKRIAKWPKEKVLLFTDHWYLLGLLKYCDYAIPAIKRLSRKAERLTSSELVQTLFYVNVCRKQWSMFEFECNLEKCINELTSDELAIVSMGFFKTKTVIKGTFLLARMLEKILEETSTINEITLCAILKIIRYSPHLPLIDQLSELLTRLVPEVDRLSVLCCVHVALAGTNTQFFNPEILNKIARKFVQDISATRLKDLERLTFVLTMFNFNPRTTPDIFNTVLAELRSSKRDHEITMYPRCLSSCVHYLGLQQIYPHDLIDKVLDPEFLKNTYGNNKRAIGREILSLDAALDIDCPDYKGHRLNTKLRNDLTKWSQEYIPRRDQKQRLTSADKLMLDVTETLEVVLGQSGFLHIDYILPHYQKPDIIICKDKEGSAVEVKEHFRQYTIGNIMKPPTTKDLKWYAIVIGSWNMNIRNTVKPVGTLNTKLRQLKKIGYEPVLVFWSEFMQLSREQKENYIRSKLM